MPERTLFKADASTHCML